jgi:thiamine-monophosphate kinase
MAGEFDLIDRYFGQRSARRVNPLIPIGIGDDCAAVTLAPGATLLTSVDTFSEGVHFFSGADAFAVGHKALAVNLSDLAACGAEPVACLLALALPGVSDDWMAGFSAGFSRLSDQFSCPLIGGDTTAVRRGSGITISVTVLGQVPNESTILMRKNAQVGDDIWVSGSLGAAALSVAWQSDATTLPPIDTEALLQAKRSLEYPEPRIALGIALRHIAHACIDLSDGLQSDLGHILKASGNLGAHLHASAVPYSTVLAALPMALRQHLALAGGDDYELCFTAPVEHEARVRHIGHSLAVPLSRIGTVTANTGIDFETIDGEHINLEGRAYEHFK